MKKSFVVLGSGLMGKVAAESFISQEKEASVTLIDNDDERLKDVANAVKSDRLTVRNIDITDTDDLHNTIAGQDVILNALPLRLSLQGIEAAIRAKVPLVDLSGERPEKRVELDERVRTAGIIVIPGCGVAPGISNICVGRRRRLA
ncbi:saccharopine dehydrogenase NADP-binding domain-containing protein [candidate division KSB1 bacterium]|nr:saccharopine dehydrogenase NADP-binding domain-containing protein [candidate division KSB1 bacterium]